MKPILRGLLPGISLGLFAFALDRAHKHFQISAECIGAVPSLCLERPYQQSVPQVTDWMGGEFVPVTDFFDYVLVWNTGVSYGLLSGVPFWVLGVVIAAALLALVVWWWRAEDSLLRAGLACCVGGALSNAVDRILYGAVADFFHFHWQGYSFYIFNIADAAITFGVILMVLDLLGIGRGRKRELAE